MAPGLSRMRYSELYAREPARQASSRSKGVAGGQRKASLLPFGYRLAERSEATLRYRCLLLTVLFVPLLIWHFALRPGLESAIAGGEEAAPEPERSLAEQRRLDNTPGWEPGMMHGYDCLTAEERFDREQIATLLVRKSHITMGGEDQTGCRSGAGPCLKRHLDWLLILYIPALLYMFIALAIICDEFFVPSLEMFVEHYGISMDIAGATFMAAGGSMPELFTSLISVFYESDLGFAAIVGSAVFNVLFVIAVCTLASTEPLQLTAWPLARDCLFYIIGLGLIAVFFNEISPNEIEWWEALILFVWYNVYCGFMTINERVRDCVESWWRRKAVVPEEDEQDKEASRQTRPDKNLKMPSQFRSGIVKLLTQHASITETAGIAVFTELKCSLQESFNEMDTDGDGHITEAEFNMFMQKLGWTPPADDDVKSMKEDAASKLWRRMPLTSDDKLAFENFRKWYTVSEERIEVEVRRVFERLDRNGDGILDQDEIEKMLVLLGHRPQQQEIEEVVSEIMSVKGSSADSEAGDEGEAAPRPRKVSVHFDQFEKWYFSSMFGKEHRRRQGVEAKEEEGFSIDWPEADATWSQWFWYFFSYPLCAAMYCTLPDIRRPGMEGKVKWAIIEFLLSLFWIAVFALALYECTVVCSNTIGIPSPVAGVTIVAAGTSVPDLLSSYIVARKGEGDMAVSSSIGSNIFDITVGLPIPWMLWSFINNGRSVRVGTESLGASVMILMLMLMFVVFTIMIMKWRMTRPLGCVMMVLYVLFIVVDLCQQLPTGSPVLSLRF
mmetsp:Transcript_21657/g.61348  ORF Transcript_21657/g.61348 Transcript_21657/m.61348 type:complete len:782 (+) Transcript_21657:95-2440(+)